ncbi:uncharacterized protein [Rutidosis leptorrhynchoides]|uniref:uncharacterized protein n=1 Tax=Rutidosis leptorrhynchoides TaxID=125765 RepID=UPI003A99E4FE
MIKSLGGHQCILAATDYFSKWAEAISRKEVKKETIIDFLKMHIIHRYGVPRSITTDNGKNFSNKALDRFCMEFGFRRHKSTIKLPTLLRRLGMKSWVKPYGLTARHIERQGVYGTEVVLPLEQQIPSLRVALQEGQTEEESHKLRLQELEALDKKRLDAQQCLECYQDRIAKSFNKKIHQRSFQVGDLVLAVRRPINITMKMGDKFTTKWDGPYVVQEVIALVLAKSLAKIVFELVR